MKIVHSGIHNANQNPFAGQSVCTSLYRQDAARLFRLKRLKIKSLGLFYKLHLLSVGVRINLCFRQSHYCITSKQRNYLNPITAKATFRSAVFHDHVP